MLKPKREQELELEIKKLKKENEDLKKTLNLQNKQLKHKDEIIEDLQKEGKVKEYLEYKRKYEIERQLRQEEQKKYKRNLENHAVAIANLKDSLGKDSKNSSIPSSTEKIYTKKKCVNTSRKKTGRKTGAQKGHKGVGLTKEKVEELIKSGKVEHIIENHILAGANIEKSACIVKYKIDTINTTRITEHRFYIKENANEIPKEYNTDVQYDDNLKTLVTILVNEGFISLNRTKRILCEMTGNIINLSEGTLVNFSRELAIKSAPVINNIKEMLIKAGVLYVDETGVRVNGKLNWLHTATTDLYTFYQVNEKRGKEGLDNMGILSYFVGILMHDHFSSYYKYETMTQAECNAHILRYLQHVIELFKRENAAKFLEFLIKTNNLKKERISKDIHSFTKEEYIEIEKEYIEILVDWKTEYKEYIKDKKKTKSLKDEENLFNRLIKYKDEHLMFAKNFNVMFSNNFAEKSLRMIKTKLKVSGCFRGNDSGEYFTTIRSLFETTKKHGINLFDTVGKVFRNEEVIFEKT